MLRSHLLLAAAIAVPATAAAQTGGPGTPGTGGAVPALSVSTPELGALVTVTLANAQPGALVGLAYSPSAGQIVLPQGTVWLDPATTTVLFTGAADATGTATFAIPVPLVAALAELEVHLQAYASDAGAAAGAALSNSLDFRLLGSRLYAGVLEFGVGEKLLVKSAVTDADVFLADLGAVSDAPVFDATRARAAVYDAGAGAVRIFDNHFGAELFSVPAAGANPRLIADASGAGFYVLHPDRVERVEFASGAVTGLLGLGIAHHAWVGDGVGTEAYLAALGAGGQPLVRRIDLVALADLGGVALGAPGDALPWLDHAGGVTVATTTTGSTAFPPVHGVVHRIDWSGASPTVTPTDVGGAGQTGVVAVAGAGALFAWQQDDCYPFPGGLSFEMAGAPLAVGGPATSVASPSPPFGAGCIRPYLTAVDGADVWFADRCCYEPPDGDEPGALWRFDTGGLAWSAPVTLFEGPTGLAVVDDPFSHRVLTAHWAIFPFGGLGAELTSIDAATLVATKLPLTLAVVDGAGDGRTFHVVNVP